MTLGGADDGLLGLQRLLDRAGIPHTRLLDSLAALSCNSVESCLFFLDDPYNVWSTWLWERVGRSWEIVDRFYNVLASVRLAGAGNHVASISSAREALFGLLAQDRIQRMRNGMVSKREGADRWGRGEEKAEERKTY